MHIHDLKHFCLLAETLHFARASALGTLSPSALSRCIVRLEQELGCRLFERDKRSVRLTDEGRRFRAYAEESLGAYRSLRDQLLERGSELGGEVSVYASVTACFSLLPDIISRFRSAHPGVHLLLKTGDESFALARVSEGKADIAVTARPESLPPGVAFRALTRTPLVFIAPARDCSVRDMAEAGCWEGLPYILSEQGLARRRVDAWFRRRRIRPNVYAQVSGNEAILAMVGLGCGVGVVPRLVLEKSVMRHEVRELSVEPALSAYNVGLAALRRRIASPAVRALWDSAAADSPASSGGP